MSKKLFLGSLVFATLTLAGCSFGSTTPAEDPTANLTPAEKAELEQSAARMGMSAEDHLKMTQGE